MRARSLLGALAALSLSACSSLSVQVDVLDPEYVRQKTDDERTRRLLLEIVEAAPGTYRKRVEKQVNDYQNEALRLIDGYQKAVVARQSELGERLAAGWREEIERGFVLTEGVKVAQSLESCAQEVRTLSVQHEWTGSGSIPEPIRLKGHEFQTVEKSLQVAIQTDLDGLLHNMRVANKNAAALSKPTAASSEPSTSSAVSTKAPPPPPAADPSTHMPSASETSAAMLVAQRSIIQDAGLANTEFAFLVAQAPDNYWAMRFNRAFGGGYFGNSDIVIRLNSTADFSVKGLLFDGSKVAQVASKVLAQTMMVGAQIAGVPVTRVSTATQTGADALSQASADLGGVDAAIAGREAIAGAQRDAIRSAARTILGVAPSLAVTPLKTANDKDKGRLAAHDAIDTSISALADLIKAQTMQ